MTTSNDDTPITTRPPDDGTPTRVWLLAALVAATLLDVVLSGINVQVFGVEPMGAVGTAIGAVTITALSAVVAAPTYLVQQVGLVVTYAEQRAQEGPVTAAQLAAELG